MTISTIEDRTLIIQTAHDYDLEYLVAKRIYLDSDSIEEFYDSIENYTHPSISKEDFTDIEAIAKTAGIILKKGLV